MVVAPAINLWVKSYRK